MITNRFETRHEEGGRTNLVTFHLIEDPQDAVHRDFLALGLSPERTVSGKENPIPSSRQAKCKDIWRRQHRFRPLQFCRTCGFFWSELFHSQTQIDQIRTHPVEEFRFIKNIWDNKIIGEIKEPRRQRGSFNVDQDGGIRNKNLHIGTMPCGPTVLPVLLLVFREAQLRETTQSTPRTGHENTTSESGQVLLVPTEWNLAPRTAHPSNHVAYRP
jgi:hypothetical protein